ncbi:NADH dehydrogenase [ubiquinone] 1 beta subcomplex subunit 2, mitochondrial [Pseudophryne corroboree]|uniref:NADH dehydrogenase [ubiquinone] 1 beta subcomplex subunit 2, mitochondrial n=1 Tax=Pseudophryne corroboree TaxID=495146 RepID=UPI0030816ACE
MAALGRLGGALRAGSRLFAGVVRSKAGVRNAGTEVHIETRYRGMVQLTKSQCFQAELLGGFMWFWILWHFWHDPDAVLGHFPYPDASQWTDEELGILPEDEE